MYIITHTHIYDYIKLCIMNICVGPCVCAHIQKSTIIMSIVCLKLCTLHFETRSDQPQIHQMGQASEPHTVTCTTSPVMTLWCLLFIPTSPSLPPAAPCLLHSPSPSPSLSSLKQSLDQMNSFPRNYIEYIYHCLFPYQNL